MKKGNYYYKIRQTDFDGSQTSSSVKAIKVQQNHDLELNHLKTTPSASYLALNGSAKGVYTIRAYSAKGILLGEREVRLSESGSTFRFDNKVNSGNLMYLNVINQKTGKQVLGKKVVLPR
ncbi:MAG: hypothetical protein BRD49_05795 [Bacteroidetes bacterium SW_10_40_5]|nr:MAG: hypothetical protein BRD49_05795 [Bacteroidetes bacterium SW_10_40_5]